VVANRRVTRDVSLASHQVLSADGEVWDAMLNQADLSKNANKSGWLLRAQEKR
jgi:plasmid maintenance system antidote protein VapI